MNNRCVGWLDGVMLAKKKLLSADRKLVPEIVATTGVVLGQVLVTSQPMTGAGVEPVPICDWLVVCGVVVVGVVVSVVAVVVVVTWFCTDCCTLPVRSPDMVCEIPLVTTVLSVGTVVAPPVPSLRPSSCCVNAVSCPADAAVGVETTPPGWMETKKPGRSTFWTRPATPWTVW